MAAISSSKVSNLMKVFVYGTLKSEEPNHHWLTDLEKGHVTFLGAGKTVTKYPLVIASKYNIPFLLDVPDKGHNVLGEVYEVDEKMLSHLDILEDYPTFYNRREEPIELKENKSRVNCWTYFLASHKPHLLDLPMMENYSSSGPHGLVYGERYLRDPEYDYKTDLTFSTGPK